MVPSTQIPTHIHCSRALGLERLKVALGALLNLLVHVIPLTFLLFRWKTHKWRRCQLVPWSVRQDTPGAQETCGPGMQVRGKENQAPVHMHMLTAQL